MMARMPELSSRLTSPTLKPSRLSISSCDKTRSPPFLPPPKSLLPSSTMAAHCRAMVSESSLASASAAAASGSWESSCASHCAAIASWSTGSLPAIFLDPKQARRSVEVAGTQFTQIGLENIGHARQRRLDRFDLLLFLDLEYDLDLEILHPF